MKCGIKIDEFWNLTPKELNIYIDAYANKLESEFKSNVTVAYYNAYFQRAEKIPSLKTFLDDIFKCKTHMTDEELFEAIKNINTALGGE